MWLTIFPPRYISREYSDITHLQLAAFSCSCERSARLYESLADLAISEIYTDDVRS